jgi:hypothetical protein
VGDALDAPSWSIFQNSLSLSLCLSLSLSVCLSLSFSRAGGGGRWGWGPLGPKHRTHPFINRKLPRTTREKEEWEWSGGGMSMHLRAQTQRYNHDAVRVDAEKKTQTHTETQDATANSMCFFKNKSPLWSFVPNKLSLTHTHTLTHTHILNTTHHTPSPRCSPHTYGSIRTASLHLRLPLGPQIHKKNSQKHARLQTGVRTGGVGRAS